MLTFMEKIEQNCRLYPEREAVREGSRRINYGELWIYSASVYAWLHRKRIGPGDVVMVRLGNTLDAIVVCVGVLRAGAAFVIVGQNQDAQSVGYIYGDCACKARIDDGSLPQILGGKGKRGFEPVDEPALAYVIYTSGSTGRPKGVMIARGAMTLCEASTAWQGRPFVRADDRCGLLSPLTFTAGMILMNVVLSAGATIVAVPGDTLASPVALKRCFLDNRITRCFMTPTLYRAFHDFNPEMRAVVLGGEPVSDIEPSGIELYSMYGQSESGFVVAMHRVNGAEAGAVIGKPQAEIIRAEILDKAGLPARDGDAGELCYENPWFRGYVGMEAETRSVLRGGLVHSGDLCRRLPDGALLMLGRNDDMVKIHGLWFNAAEIESAVARRFDVDWVHVRCLAASTRVFVCVYYGGRTALSLEDAREKLRGQLPDYMLPTHFYRLDQLPTSRNGKVDYGVLPSPLAPTPTPAPVSPDRLEREIADIVERALGQSAPVGRDANLISLGLSSLASIVMIGEIEEKTGVRLSLDGIMAHPDIAHICEAVRDALDRGQARSEGQEGAAERRDYLPLTRNQLAVFAECEANRDSVQYNLPAYFAFSRSDMDAPRLEDAIRQVFDRHGAFRTRIVRRRDIPEQARIDGCEVCQVLTDAPLAVDYAQMAHDFGDETRARAYFQGKVRSFDLYRDRLYRVEIVGTPGKLYLFFDMHHIISDGYSLRLLADDITRALAGAPVSAERLTFSEYIAGKAARGVSGVDDRAYAEALTAGAASFKYPCRLPEESARRHSAARIERNIAADEIAAWCRRNGVTQGSYFHAALLLTLYLLTGEKPFIATTYSGRAEQPEALMHTVGFFARSVPVVWSFGDDAEGIGALPPDALIRQVQAQVMATCSRDGVLYSDLPVRSDVLLTFQGALGAAYIDRHRATVLNPEVPVFPIHLMVVHAGPTFEISLSYDAALFSGGDMRLLCNAFERVLHRLHSVPALREIALVESVDAGLLKARSGRHMPIEAGATWLRDFGRQAVAQPGQLAVCAENGSYTYGELDGISDRMALWLSERGVKPGDFVAVRMPRVREFLAAILGIHKCGAAYVPIDEDCPEPRIACILKDSGASVLVTREIVEVLGEDEHRPFPARATATGNAYMIYTSGSTGDPKGVVIPHGALYNYLRYVVDAMKLGPESRISCYASFAFDISIEGLLAPLMAGGACFIVPSSIRKDVAALETYLRDNGVTGGCFPTQIGQLLGRRAPLDLDYITLIGEKMTVVPGNRGHVYNAYGPTECTVVVTYHDVRKDWASADIPIGKPMYNTTVLILDPLGNLLPNGAVGELCVAGAQLARGYHNQPEKTARAFAPLRQAPALTVYHTGDLARVLPDGNLMFPGRADRQIKRRGYRIEPGEIEVAALRQPGIREAAVNAVDDKLVLYYTASDAAASEAALVDAMKATLPHYMLPDGYMRLEAMPLTPNGKLDARRLPAFRFKSGRYMPPGNEVERAMCQLMAGILHVERVGITDDFFDLGGNSLDAAQLALALGEGFEISDIYQGRTVSGILRETRGKRRFYGYDRLSVYPLTEEQKKFFFDNEIGARPEISYGNVPMLLQLPDDANLERLQSMLKQVIDNHPYLKVRYMENPDPLAEAREWYVARRDDAIPAEVSLIRARRLDREGLIRPYNLLGDGNLYRAALYDTQDEGKFLFLDFHHVLIDEVCWRVMADDLKALMAGRKPTPEGVSGYEAALEERWRREDQRDKIIACYRDLLKGCDSSINSWIYDRRDMHTLLERFEKFDEQKGLACMMGSRVIRVSRSRVGMGHVRERCRQLHITESMFFNAAFACLLGEWNGLSKALYATVIANRDYAALERTVTMLCRTVPIFLEVTEGELSTPPFLEQLRRVISNANRASVLSCDSISATIGLSFPKITLIYYDKPVSQTFIPGCRRVPLNTLDSVDTVLLKVYRDEEDNLYLKFDASLDFSAQEIDRMAERMDALLMKI